MKAKNKKRKFRLARIFQPKLRPTFLLNGARGINPIAGKGN